jgi:pantetheine-phosphate adenylyltransferase
MDTAAVSNASVASVRQRPVHDRVIVAGTFDRMHEGHFDLLDKAFEVGRHVEIWISDDAMIRAKATKLGQSLRTFDQRSDQVAEWARDHCCKIEGGRAAAACECSEAERCYPYRGRFTVHELHDPFGPSITDPTYTAIVCSAETREGCEAINAARIERGMPPLQIYAIDLRHGPRGEKLSSTAIRAAEAFASESTCTSCT